MNSVRAWPPFSSPPNTFQMNTPLMANVDYIDFRLTDIRLQMIHTYLWRTLHFNRQMSVIPVSLSMTLSFISAILILGMPAEMYAFGTQFWMDNIGMILGAVMAAILFVPLLYPLRLYSCYEV